MTAILYHINYCVGVVINLRNYSQPFRLIFCTHLFRFINTCNFSLVNGTFLMKLLIKSQKISLFVHLCMLKYIFSCYYTVQMITMKMHALQFAMKFKILWLHTLKQCCEYISSNATWTRIPKPKSTKLSRKITVITTWRVRWKMDGE